jgi:aspartate racemase
VDGCRLSRAETVIWPHNDVDALDALVAAAQGLVRAGAQVLAVPCNTAHYFLPQIQDAVDALVVDMIAEACVEMARSGVGCVGLLGTTATVQTGLYTTRLAQANVRLVAPADDEQGEASALIHAIKVDGGTPDAVSRGAALVE